jgi:hypothetical protein
MTTEMDMEMDMNLNLDLENYIVYTTVFVVIALFVVCISSLYTHFDNMFQDNRDHISILNHKLSCQKALIECMEEDITNRMKNINNEILTKIEIICSKTEKMNNTIHITNKLYDTTIYKIQNEMKLITNTIYECKKELMGNIEFNLSGIRSITTSITRILDEVDELCSNNSIYIDQIRKDINHLSATAIETNKQINTTQHMVLIGYYYINITPNPVSNSVSNASVAHAPLFVPNDIEFDTDTIYKYGILHCSIIIDQLKFLKNVKALTLDDFINVIFVKSMTSPQFPEKYKKEIILNSSSYFYDSPHYLHTTRNIKQLHSILSEQNITLILNPNAEQSIRI